MSETSYQIIFKGKVVRGHDENQVKANFARLFKLSEEKVAILFDGSERIIKKSMSLEQANAFRSKLKQAGIRVSLRQNAELKPEKADELVLSAPGVMLIPPAIKPDIHIETAHIQFREDDRPIVNKSQVNEPDIDFSALQMDEPGVKIVESQKVSEVSIDTDNLTIDEPGTIIVQKKVIPEPDIAVDAMTLEEPGAILVEKKQYTSAEISIDHIQFVEESEQEKPEE